MTDDELERLLAESFDTDARRQVDDHALPPAPRFARPGGGRTSRRSITRYVAPLATVAAVVAVIAVVLGLTSDSPKAGPQAGGSSTPQSSALTKFPPSSSSSAAHQKGPAGSPVRVELASEPTTDVGVGLPVVAYFSRKITNGRAWASATRVDVNGTPVTAAWYFEDSVPTSGHVMEAHLRMRTYWPADSQVTVTVDARGRTAGPGLTFASDVQTSFRTGARQVAVVNSTTHRMTVLRNGNQIGSFKVSLGASSTPTFRGTKVIMTQQPSVCMHNIDSVYYECGIKWDQRLTYSGEYLHAAPWNMSNIKAGINTSNGCTNLMPGAAHRLYRMLHVGDVVRYPNADGPEMQLGDGYGDWDVSWHQWRTGGAVPTH